MLRHFFQIAWRNLKKRKLFGFINIAGLSIGMACCLLITLYIQNEFSYDRYNAKADRIYRVTQTFRTVQKGENPGPPSPRTSRSGAALPSAPHSRPIFPKLKRSSGS